MGNSDISHLTPRYTVYGLMCRQTRYPPRVQLLEPLHVSHPDRCDVAGRHPMAETLWKLGARAPSEPGREGALRNRNLQLARDHS